MIRIDSNDWFIVKDVPILFRNSASPQVRPNKVHFKDALDRFVDLLNLKSDDMKLLYKVYLISCFIPEIAKPMFLISGSSGGAKTSLHTHTKMAIDPSIMTTTRFPETTNDLIQLLCHNYVVYFDNISYISSGLADDLCRAITGIGFLKRKLYKDDEDVVYFFRSIIGINGINLPSKRSDFINRGIVFESEGIDKNDRIRETKMVRDVEFLIPDMLGCIFDILTVVRRNKNDSIEIEKGFNEWQIFMIMGNLLLLQ